jgi:hypothetical protein
MDQAYRNDLDILRSQITQLRKRYISELFSLSPVFFDVYQRRLGRIWAGFAGVAGATFLGLYAIVEGNPNATHVLLGAILFPFVAALISRLFVGRLLLQRLLSRIFESDEPHLLYERLRSESAKKNLKDSIERLEQLSVGLPLVALSLLAPLTIHLLFFFLLGSNSLQSFDNWILGSLLLVGHSHIILACYSWSYSRTLAESPTSDFSSLGRRGWAVLWIVTACSLFPGVIFTSSAVFITGLFFVPAMFGWASWALSKERLAIEIAS